MERSGLIRRERDAGDRRKMRLFLTEPGRELYRTLITPATAIPEAALAGLSPAEIEMLVRHLEHVQGNLDDYYERLLRETQASSAAVIPPLGPANS
jgi:DNA-binding MarR family transcriptional regulator